MTELPGWRHLQYRLLMEDGFHGDNFRTLIEYLETSANYGQTQYPKDTYRACLLHNQQAQIPKRFTTLTGLNNNYRDTNVQ